MPKVTEEHRIQQRQRIQQAAAAVAQRKGLGALTMGDIIKESGLSAGAIYGYYAGKDELVGDVARTVMGSRQELVREMMGRSPVPAPSAMLRELLSTLPPELIQGGLLLQFWSEIGTGGGIRTQAQANLASLLGQVEEYLVAWERSRGLTPAEAARAAARLTPALSGLAQGYILQAGVLNETMDRNGYLDAVAELLDGALAG